ncbi:MAG: tetratricopeptide repeat protein [Planctomycetaceae bacterium]|nr:tetratricopeptide repeat protein [Planctomycetaceae bacterium]
MLKHLTFSDRTSRWNRGWIAVCLALILPVTVLACEWDYDTLKQERSRFPSTLELITGKFWRHSPEFYEWRIKDRLERLKSEPKNLDLLDDLAVAYRKTGKTDRAIEVMLDKEKIKPGEYKTYSNLGTFYILAGDFEKGLPYIDKALAINPNAHFGREKYQKWLVEYAQSRMKDGKLTLPLRVKTYPQWPEESTFDGFDDYVRKCEGTKYLSRAQVQAAIKGVQGMMRFADYQNPLLLEALGDLLLAGGGDDNARQLAARSYLQASYVVKDKEASLAYRNAAERALEHQVGKGRSETAKPQEVLGDLETEFKGELAQAEKWYAAAKQKELALIKDGRRVEDEYDRLAAKPPSVSEINPVWFTREMRIFTMLSILGIGMLVTMGVMFLGLRWLWKKISPDYHDRKLTPEGANSSGSV